MLEPQPYASQQHYPCQIPYARNLSRCQAPRETAVSQLAALQIGEVVKARVLSADVAARRLSLSLVPAKQAALADPISGQLPNGNQAAAGKASSKPVKVGFADDGAAVDALGGLQPGAIVQGQIVQQQAEVGTCLPATNLNCKI